MQDMSKTKKKLGIKEYSTGPWQEGVSKHTLNADGTVGVICKCSHWDLESDRMGYCRDENCRYERLVKAFYNGEAVKLKNGTILWCPGVKIRK